VAETPDQLTLERNRDLEGRRDLLWRRAGILAVGIVLALALGGLFGQRPTTSTAAAGAAELELSAPSRVRGGLYFQARFTVEAVRELREATLVLDRGWTEGMTINTIEPSPVGEASRDGKLVLELGHVPSGEAYVLYLQLQVNPTNVGRRSQDVRLFDGETELAHLERTVTVWP
jgi:hypothetical protein